MSSRIKYSYVSKEKGEKKKKSKYNQYWLQYTELLHTELILNVIQNKEK